MSNILSSSRFLTEERQAELRAMGVDLDTRHDTTAMDLPEPEPGCPVVGELTSEEAALFTATSKVYDEMNELQRLGVANLLTVVAGLYRENKVKDGLEPGKPVNDEDAVMRGQYFAKLQQWKYLHAMLYWSLGERLKMHDRRLGVRAGLKIVDLGLRTE